MRTTSIRQRPPTDSDTTIERATAALPEPMAITITDACRISGLSRSEIYRQLNADQIHAIKSGVRTLVLTESLRRHLESLPRARFGTQTNAA